MKRTSFLARTIFGFHGATIYFFQWSALEVGFHNQMGATIHA